MAIKIQVGLIGGAIQASGSTRLHMAEGRQQDLDLNYKLLDLDFEPEGARALERMLGEAEKAGYAGVNITHPCKQSVIAFLDELSDAAQTMGAVNTVVFKGGRRIGHNTDWFGFHEGFRRDLPDVAVTTVTQLGAGGAGSAVAYAAMQLGVGTLNVLDTDPVKATQLRDRLSAKYPGRIRVITELPEVVAQSDGVINTTPMGMAKYPGLPLPANLLRSSLWVAEVVYFPLETELLKTARALGCRTMDGVSMVVNQAAEAFFLFTGVKPNADRMLEWFHENIRS